MRGVPGLGSSGVLRTPFCDRMLGFGVYLGLLGLGRLDLGLRQRRRRVT